MSAPVCNSVSVSGHFFIFSSIDEANHKKPYDNDYKHHPEWIRIRIDMNWGLPCNNSIGAWRHFLSLFSSDEMIGNLSENKNSEYSPKKKCRSRGSKNTQNWSSQLFSAMRIFSKKKSLYYKYIEMSAKHKSIVSSVNRSLYAVAHGIERASRTKKGRARDFSFNSTSLYK